MNTYKVTSPSDREIIIKAKSSKEAKTLACKFWGIKPSDKWCGITALKAIKLNRKDV